MPTPSTIPTYGRPADRRGICPRCLRQRPSRYLRDDAGCVGLSGCRDDARWPPAASRRAWMRADRALRTVAARRLGAEAAVPMPAGRAAAEAGAIAVEQLGAERAHALGLAWEE